MSKALPSRKKQSIEAIFIQEIGRWDKSSNTFVDLSTSKTIRNIEMVLCERDDKQILKFVGGPTGFESYYVEDLLALPFAKSTFCICGGTINRWPRCEVSSTEVAIFLKKIGANHS
jgi:hypothetical protein